METQEFRSLNRVVCSILAFIFLRIGKLRVHIVGSITNRAFQVFYVPEFNLDKGR